MRLRARGGRAAARTFIDSLIDDAGGPNRSETRSVRSIAGAWRAGRGVVNRPVSVEMNSDEL